VQVDAWAAHGGPGGDDDVARCGLRKIASGVLLYKSIGYAYRFACVLSFCRWKSIILHAIGMPCYSLCDTSSYLWQICIESQACHISFFFAGSGLFACSRNAHC
jgi:hypothetical protein